MATIRDRVQTVRSSAAPIRPTGSPVAENGGTPSPDVPDAPHPGPTPAGTQPTPGAIAGPAGALPAQPVSIPTTPPPQPAPQAPPAISHVPPTQQPAENDRQINGPRPLPASAPAIPQIANPSQVTTAKPATPSAQPTPTPAPIPQPPPSAAPPAAMKPIAAPAPVLKSAPDQQIAAPTPGRNDMIRTADFQDKNGDGRDDRDVPVDLSPFGIPGEVSPINPADDLRGKVIAPGSDPRLDKYAQRSDKAMDELALLDRFKLAKEKFDQFAADTQSQYEFANRVATQRAAAKGRTGSGMLRTDWGNLDLARGRELDSAKNRFLQDALEGTVDDSFRRADTLAGAEDSLRGNQRVDRQEVRGERDYQNEMERQAFNRRRQSVFDDEALTEGRFGRDLKRAQFGEYGNPGYSEIDVAGRRRDSANMDAQAIADLFRQLGQNAGQGSGLGTPDVPDNEIDAILESIGQLPQPRVTPGTATLPPVVVGTKKPDENRAAYEAAGLVWAPGSRSHGQRRN